MSSLFVGGLPFAMTQEELAELFRSHGEVVNVKLVMDRETGRSKGFGFVDFADAAQAQAALKAMNGSMVGGRKLFVNEARPQEKRPPPGPVYAGPERRSGRDRRRNPGLGAPSRAQEPRPFGADKPWAKREGGFAKKPWAKKEGDFEKKPWVKKDGGFGKPWDKKPGGRAKWGPGGPGGGKKPGQFKRKPRFGFGGGKPGRHRD